MHVFVCVRMAASVLAARASVCVCMAACFACKSVCASVLASCNQSSLHLLVSALGSEFSA